MLVIWDSVWGTPKRTYFTPHEFGVESLDICPNSTYIVTLSGTQNENLYPAQTISLWDITIESNEPIVSTTFT